MYIIEVLLKKIIQKNPRHSLRKEEPVYKKCNHIFLPIDSSERRFVCSKCGQYAELEPKT